MYTFKDLIDYIKLDLGASINKLEFSDNDLMEIIKTQSLREFSIYLPYEEFVKIGGKDLISQDYYLRYKIPTERRIIDINEIYVHTDYVNVSDIDTAPGELDDMETYMSDRDVASLRRSMTSVTTYKLIPPFYVDLRYPYVNEDAVRNQGFILNLNTVHDDVTTIPYDQYPELRDLALGDIKVFLGNLRKKYQSMNTPYGIINLNADELKQEGEQLRQNAIQRLKSNPPRQYIYFLNDY